MRTLRLLCLLSLGCTQSFYTYTLTEGENPSLSVEVTVGAFDTNDDPPETCWLTVENKQVNIMTGLTVEYDPAMDWQEYIECGTGTTIFVDDSTDVAGVELTMPNCTNVKNTCYWLKYNDSYSFSVDDTGDTGGSDTATE